MLAHLNEIYKLIVRFTNSKKTKFEFDKFHFTKHEKPDIIVTIHNTGKKKRPFSD